MKFLLLSAIFIFLSCGCATPNRYNDMDYANKKEFITHPDNILITKDDITDRPYEVIEDIKASYSKTTLFHEDPTTAHIDSKLKYRASKLGADAIIFVRYGTVGISFASWGTLEGSGRAIKFIK